MPDSSYESLSADNCRKLREYEPGYDWIPDRFGPPPGIPRQRKKQLDAMNDRDYMAVVMRMGQEEKESLMISEQERLRTYQTLWPNPPFLNVKDLTREGFYYTGVSDRVQCAFCGGFLGNWEKHDVPRESHRKFFSYCKMAQRKACANIPISNNDSVTALNSELRTELLNTRADDCNKELTARDLGISRSVAKHPRFKVGPTRLGSYKNYSASHPMTAKELCDAGFFFEGPGDKVRCFWCDGALELWSHGDNAWKEHAKWYPGCSFVQQIKGKDFIKLARSEMSPDELSTADLLEYNNSGLDFLKDMAPGLKEEKMELGSKSHPVTEFDTYQVCKSIGFPEEHLMEAFKLNNYNDFADVQTLISTLLAITDKDSAKLETLLEQERTAQGSGSSDDEAMDLAASDDEGSVIDVTEFIKDSSDLDEDSAMKVSIAMTCKMCRKEKLGAIILPCGDFVLCQTCSAGKLPSRCPTCRQPVRGSCKVFLN